MLSRPIMVPLPEPVVVPAPKVYRFVEDSYSAPFGIQEGKQFFEKISY